MPDTASAQEMQLLSHWDFGPTFDVVTKDNYLYLAAGEQVRIYDITTKEKLMNIIWQNEPVTGVLTQFPEPDNILHTQGFIEGLYIDGNYLYIANDKYFKIADISDPKNSFVISQLEADCKDVVVGGDYAYITSDGIKVIDISDKANPISVKHINLAGSNKPRRMDISGNYLYVVSETDHRLDIIDISNPTNPQIVGDYTNGAVGTNSYSSVAVKDNHAYVIEYHYGIRAIDVSDPTNPTEVDSIIGENNPNANDIKIIGDYAYISTRYEGFIIVDISNPTNINIAKRINVLPGYEEGIFISQLPYGNFTFISANTIGLGIVDTTDITNPQVMDRVLVPGGGDSIAVKEDHVYMGAHNDGIWVINVSNPANPREEAFIKNKGRNSGVEIQGDYLFVGGEWTALSVIDISNPPYPELIVASYRPDSDYLGGSMVAVDNYLYTYGLTIYDISNPANPSKTYKQDLGFGFGAETFTRYGEDHLICGGQNGLFIVDISNRLNPVIVGNYNIDMYTGDAEVVGSRVYAGSSNKLYSIDISDVSDPILLDNIGATGANSVEIYGTTAYVLPKIASWGGLKAIDISNPTDLKMGDILEDVGGNGYDAGFDEEEGILYTASGYIISASGAGMPFITIINPENKEYATESLWANITLNKDGDWCGYSLQGNENITMTGTGQKWTAILTELSQIQYNIQFWCNDTTGNMSSSEKRYFTIVECLTDGNCGIGQYCSNNQCKDKKSDGAPCNNDEECTSNECCHNTCKPICPYCGDGHCDGGETHINCPSDCSATTTTTISSTTTTTAITGGDGGSGGGGGGGTAGGKIVESCFDGIQNCHTGSCEENIDCGGPCKPCAGCSDGIQNQGEEGIDCGGPCKPCEIIETCGDGMQNQGETGIDCGGPCNACESCTDGIRNQGEEGVDCGGPCSPCNKILELEEQVMINIQTPSKIEAGEEYPVEITIENTGDTPIGNLDIRIGDQTKTTNLDLTEKKTLTYHLTASEQEGEYAIKAEAYTGNEKIQEQTTKFTVNPTPLTLKATTIDDKTYITTKTNHTQAIIELTITKNGKLVYADLIQDQEHIIGIPAGNYQIKATLKAQGKTIITKEITPTTQQETTPQDMTMLFITPLIIINLALTGNITKKIIKK